MPKTGKSPGGALIAHHGYCHFLETGACLSLHTTAISKQKWLLYQLFVDEIKKHIFLNLNPVNPVTFNRYMRS